MPFCGVGSAICRQGVCEGARVCQRGVCFDKGRRGEKEEGRRERGENRKGSGWLAGWLAMEQLPFFSLFFSLSLSLSLSIIFSLSCLLYLSSPLFLFPVSFLLLSLPFFSLSLLSLPFFYLVSLLFPSISPFSWHVRKVCEVREILGVRGVQIFSPHTLSLSLYLSLPLLFLHF